MGNDTITGGPGNDVLYSEGGYDIMIDTEGDKNYFFDTDGGDVWTAVPGPDIFTLLGSTAEKGPTEINELTLNDRIVFKNKCGGYTRFVERDVQKKLGLTPENNSISGPWEISMNEEKTEGTLCRKGST